MSSYSATNLSTRQPGLSFGLLLTYFLLQTTSIRGVRFVSLSQNLAGFDGRSWGMLSFDESSYVSPGLVYGSCEINPQNDQEKHCTFVMETSSNVGSLEHLRFCNFTIKAYERGLHNNEQSLRAIDKDKAAWVLYSDYVNLSIIHFSDCRVVPVNLGKIQFPSIQPALDGVFDVTYSDANYHAGSYRTVVDFEGNIVVSPRPDWFFSSVFTISSPLKQRLVVRTYHYRNAIQVSEVDYEGSVEVLKEYPLRFNDDCDCQLKKFTVSPSHVLLSICAEKNLTVNCAQFDWNGVLKFEINFSLANYTGEYILKSYNLPGGGLIILIFKCSPDNFAFLDYCSKRAGDYHIVKKFDSTGRYVGSLQLWRFSAKDGRVVNSPHLFENEDRQLCLSALDNKNLGGQITLDVACFEDQDFFL